MNKNIRKWHKTILLKMHSHFQLSTLAEGMSDMAAVKGGIFKQFSLR